MTSRSEGQPDLIVRADRVATPAGVISAEVHVRDGVIAEVVRLDGRTTAAGGPRSDGTVDAAARAVPERQPSPGPARHQLASDEILLPGLVDTHVHVNEPGRTHWEGFATATAAAAAGGITTLIDMPLNSIPPTINLAALQVKRQAADGRCHMDVGFWAGAVPDNELDLASLHDAGVFGFKCFLVDSGVPEFPPLDEAGLARAMRRVAELGSLLIVHAEDAGCIASAADQAGSDYDTFLRSRPPDAEIAAIAAVASLARQTGARVHILHLSSAEAVPLVAAAQADGVALSAETCPHYLTLSADQVRVGQTQFKCCPPIRDAANQARLWDALAAGVISCVVSDHSPCPPELKALDSGDFGAAWGGISSVQLGLPVIWSSARKRGFGLAEVIRWMAGAPAALAGLSDRGVIAPGASADLVAFAPDDEFVVTPDLLLTRHRLTPYTGQRLTGVVRRTWLRGAQLDPGRPAGRLLTAT